MAQGLSPIRKRGRLSDALQQLGRHSEDLLGVPCHVRSGDLPGGFTETAATHLYRIAQEAITNAAKHGKATRIEIACDGGPDGMVLTIADDGVGVDPAALDRGGMGMHIMRYRARSIGGDLTVAPRRGGGTLVKCRCPWSENASAPPAAAD
jgi:two-component system CheB/CheR fusion protein